MDQVDIVAKPLTNNTSPIDLLTDNFLTAFTLKHPEIRTTRKGNDTTRYDLSPSVVFWTEVAKSKSLPHKFYPISSTVNVIFINTYWLIMLK